jgi:hypothetical protein
MGPHQGQVRYELKTLYRGGTIGDRSTTLMIQKILNYLDKKDPLLAQTSNLLTPMRAPPDQDFDWGA